MQKKHETPSLFQHGSGVGQLYYYTRVIGDYSSGKVEYARSCSYTMNEEPKV